MMGTPLTVTAGGALEGIEVRMAPQAVITGTVLDEDGDPLEGVRVMLLREIDAGGGKQLVPAGTQGSTDDRGHFRIAGIAPGAYCLSANPEGWGSRERAIRQGPEQTYPEMFYPGTRDPDEAQSIQVAMGAQLSGFELRLIPAAAYRVRGRIEMPEAVPPFPIMIRLDRDRYGRHAGNFGGGHGGRMMQTGGAFDLGGVLPGSYTLMVNCQAGGRQRQAAIEVEVIDRNVEGIVVTFPEGFALRGVVRPGPGGADVPMGGIPLSLHSPRDPRQQAQAHTDSNGAFTILDLPPGRYRVNVFPAPRDGYVQSVRYGASEWKDGCIDLQPEAEAALQVVLAFDTGEVSGTVVDASGRPVPGGTVRLLVDRGSYSDRDRANIERPKITGWLAVIYLLILPIH